MNQLQMNITQMIRTVVVLTIMTLSGTRLFALEKADDSAEFESKILGEWVLHNAKGTPVADMEIKRNEKGYYELKRLRGGALTVCGEYRLAGTSLIKVAKAGDAYSDMTWQYSFERLKLKTGDYKNWLLARKALKRH